MSAWPLVRNRRVLWSLAWIIATACLACFLPSANLAAAWHEIADADAGWILVALAGNFAMLPLLTVQWALLLPRARPIRWRVLWDCVTLSLAAMNTLPFGGGHAVAVGLLATRGEAGVEGGVSLLALEQLCDGVAKLALLLVALAAAPLPPIFHDAAWAMSAAVLAGFAGMLWLATHPVTLPFARKWQVRLSRYLEVLRRPWLLVSAIGLSLAMKGFGLIAVYAVQRSLGFHLPLATTAVVLAAVTFATAVALSPGNLGTFEAAVVAAYRLFGVPTDEAVALSLVQHACFLLPLVGTGYAMTAWRTLVAPNSRLRRSRQPAE